MFWTALVAFLSVASAEPEIQRLTPREAQASDTRELTQRVTALHAAVETLAAGHAPLPGALAVEARQNVWSMGHLVLSIQASQPEDDPDQIDDELLSTILAVETQLDQMLADTTDWDAEMVALVENTAQIRALSRVLLGAEPIESIASTD